MRYTYTMTADSVARFAGRAENYAKYRPHYAPGMIDLCVSECGLTQASVVADIGSGTGILSELFLDHGNRVFGVEPNREMRETAERVLGQYPNFVSVNGKAEATTLAGQSVDFVTVGHAFHWFDQDATRKEFLRIVMPDGWILLAWNERRLETTPFLREFEDFLLRLGTDYQQIRHENTQRDIDSFFDPAGYKLAVFPSQQEFDLEGLTGRVLSNSYVPQPDQPGYQSMCAELRDIFLVHQNGGKVIIEYDTKVYYGRRSAIER
jgi:SAM-dependent methyltransferase